MILLLLSIAGSAAIYALFKLFPRYRIDTFQAIVFNYLVASSFGFAVASSSGAYVFDADWLPYAGLVGVSFITLFYLMAQSSQIFGVAVTGLSTKMSLVVPVSILLIFDPSENLTLGKILGIGLGIVAVYLSVAPDRSNPTADIEARNGRRWIPAVVFVGSGLLDLILAYTEKFVLGSPEATRSFTPIPFGIAGLIGLSILAWRAVKGKMIFTWRNVTAGLILGLVNYASIYFLLRFLGSGWLDRSAAIPVNNIGVVVLSAFLGFLIFKEKLTQRKLVGLLLAVGSILVLTLWIG